MRWKGEAGWGLYTSGLAEDDARAVWVGIDKKEGAGGGFYTSPPLSPSPDEAYSRRGGMSIERVLRPLSLAHSPFGGWGTGFPLSRE